MPIDPATVPTLTEQEIGQFRHEYRTTQTSFEAILNAVYALAASRVDTAEVERTAAREALTEAAVKIVWDRSVTSVIEASEFIDRLREEKYAPTPRVPSETTDPMEMSASELYHTFWEGAVAGKSRAERALTALRDAMVDRASPAPAPRECVLSDGSVVRWTGAWFTRDNAMGHAIRGSENPLALLTKQHIGADFDKLKAFAAEVGQ